MQAAVVFLSALTLAGAQHSPNAELVAQLFGDAGTRHSSNIVEDALLDVVSICIHSDLYEHDHLNCT